MKTHQTFFQSVCFCLLIGVVGPVGQAMAAQNCSEIDGYAKACGSEQATRLDLAEECTDIDGMPTACGNTQPTRVEMAAVESDIDGFPTAGSKARENEGETGRILLTSQSL